MNLPGLPQKLVEVVAESSSPGVGEECPQTLLSRAGRPSILCAQVTGSEATWRRFTPNCQHWQAGSVLLDQPPVAVHEPNSRVTRSADPASITDPAGSPGAERLAELNWPAFGARHGRGAFTTDLRGGLSQWHGGRLGSLDSWYGARTASAVVCLLVIVPAWNNLMSAVCSRPVPAADCLMPRPLIRTRRLSEIILQPVNRFTITRSPGQ